MPVSLQNQIRPDFIGEDNALVPSEHLHCLLNFFSFPYASAGVVRRAEHGKMNVILADHTIHILVVHAPHALFILLQGRRHTGSPVFLHGKLETDIGRRMEENSLSGRSKRLHGTCQAAKNAILIANGLPRQPLYLIALLLPADDCVIILLRRIKITEHRVLRSLNDVLLNGRHRGKIHVCHPHRDPVKALLHLSSRNRDDIHRNGILVVPVNDGVKIVLHFSFLAFRVVRYGQFSVRSRT